MRWCTLLVLAMIGCGGGAQFQATNPPPHAPETKDPATVRFYGTNDEKPFRDYVEVGEMKADSTLGATAAMNALREEAGKHGCDGVLLKPREDGTGVGGTCIMYK